MLVTDLKAVWYACEQNQKYLIGSSETIKVWGQARAAHAWGNPGHPYIYFYWSYYSRSAGSRSQGTKLSNPMLKTLNIYASVMINSYKLMSLTCSYNEYCEEGAGGGGGGGKCPDSC